MELGIRVNEPMNLWRASRVDLTKRKNQWFEENKTIKTTVVRGEKRVKRSGVIV